MEEKYEDILKDTVTELKKVLGKMEDNQRRDERIEELRTGLQENDEIENWNAFYQGEEILENDFNKEDAIEELKQLLEDKSRQERELEDIRKGLNEVVKSKQEEVNRMDARIEELRVGLQENDEIENWNRSLGENGLNYDFNKEEAIQELKQLLSDREEMEKERSNIEALANLVGVSDLDRVYHIISEYDKLFEEVEKKQEELDEQSMYNEESRNIEPSISVQEETTEVVEQVGTDKEELIEEITESVSEENSEASIEENKERANVVEHVSDYEEIKPDSTLTLEDIAERENYTMQQGKIFINDKEIETPTVEDMMKIDELQEKSEEHKYRRGPRIVGAKIGKKQEEMPEQVVSEQEKIRQEKLQQLYGIVIDMSKDYLDILDKYEYLHKYYARVYTNVSETSIENEIQRLEGNNIIDSIKGMISEKQRHNDDGRLNDEIEELASLLKEIEERKVELERVEDAKTVNQTQTDSKATEAKTANQTPTTPKVANQKTEKQEQTTSTNVAGQKQEKQTPIVEGKTIKNISIGTEIIITYSDNYKSLIKIEDMKKNMFMKNDEKVKLINRMYGSVKLWNGKGLVLDKIDPLFVIALENAKENGVSSQEIKRVFANYEMALDKSMEDNQVQKEATSSILTYDRRGFTKIWGIIMHGKAYKAIIATSDKAKEFATVIEDENEYKSKEREEKRRAEKAEKEERKDQKRAKKEEEKRANKKEKRGLFAKKIKAIPAPVEEVDEEKMKVKEDKKKTKRKNRSEKLMTAENWTEEEQWIEDEYIKGEETEDVHERNEETDDIRKRVEVADTVKEDLNEVSRRYSEEPNNMNDSGQINKESSIHDWSID